MGKQPGETNMIGMHFISFLSLLVISVIVSAVLHYYFEYYVTPGHWSFGSKVACGVGGCLAGLTSLQLLAPQDTRPALRRCLVRPGNPGITRFDYSRR